MTTHFSENLRRGGWSSWAASPASTQSVAVTSGTMRELEPGTMGLDFTRGCDKKNNSGCFFLNFAGICCLNAYVKFLFGNVLCVVNVIVVMALSSLEKGLNKPKYWQRDSNIFDECLSTNLFLNL